MPDGRRDAHLGKLGDEIGDPRHLGRQRGVQHMPTGSLLVACKQVWRGLMHEQMLRHGTLVLARQAGTLEVDAQQGGTVVRTPLDDLSRLLDAPQRLLGRVRENRAQPAGDAL